MSEQVKYAKREDLAVGTQVIYVPTHAEDDLSHFDCEEGFVTSVKGGYAFVRYFAKDGGARLRTTMCSESTPICALVVVVHRPQARIEWLLDYLGYKKRKEVKT